MKQHALGGVSLAMSCSLGPGAAQIILGLLRRYVQTGNAVVVVHTLGNPGGELAAQIQATPGSSMGMAPMSGAAHGTGHALSTMMAASPAMMATTPSMPAMAGMPMGGG